MNFDKLPTPEPDNGITAVFAFAFIVGIIGFLAAIALIAASLME